MPSPPPRRALLVIAAASALVFAGVIVARWSQDVPVVKYQPGDQNVTAGERSEWTFDDDAVGALPHGAEVCSGNWAILSDANAPTPPNVLCQTATAAFPALCLSDRIFTNVEVSVRFKCVSGNEDQAAGVLFRVQDAENYYIFRANALEDNVMFFRYASGKRNILKRNTHRIPSGQWQELKVEVVGNQFRGFVDGNLVAEVSDDSYLAGRVGLWTKADSVTCFDDFLVVAK
jgi:hypothetical protein